MQEQATLYTRNPLDVIKDLLSRPAFAECTVYAPCQVYTSEARDVQMYSEMNTGQWWRKAQASNILISILTLH